MIKQRILDLLQKKHRLSNEEIEDFLWKQKEPFSKEEIETALILLERHESIRYNSKDRKWEYLKTISELYLLQCSKCKKQVEYYPHEHQRRKRILCSICKEKHEFSKWILVSDPKVYKRYRNKKSQLENQIRSYLEKKPNYIKRIAQKFQLKYYTTRRILQKLIEMGKIEKGRKVINKQFYRIPIYRPDLSIKQNPSEWARLHNLRFETQFSGEPENYKYDFVIPVHLDKKTGCVHWYKKVIELESWRIEVNTKHIVYLFRKQISFEVKTKENDSELVFYRKMIDEAKNLKEKKRNVVKNELIPYLKKAGFTIGDTIYQCGKDHLARRNSTPLNQNLSYEETTYDESPGEEEEEKSTDAWEKEITRKENRLKKENIISENNQDITPDMESKILKLESKILEYKHDNTQLNLTIQILESKFLTLKQETDLKINNLETQLDKIVSLFSKYRESNEIMEEGT